MKIMVCGSRTITDKQFVFDEISNLLSELNVSPEMIIEGGARGVDEIAGEYATNNNIPLWVIPAQWAIYGKSAGYRRNVEMVKACDFCLILWDGVSKGTKHDIDICEKTNKPYKVVKVSTN